MLRGTVCGSAHEPARRQGDKISTYGLIVLDVGEALVVGGVDAEDGAGGDGGVDDMTRPFLLLALIMIADHFSTYVTYSHYQRWHQPFQQSKRIVCLVSSDLLG